MATSVIEQKQTPFEMVGGAAVVRQVVERFYALMESDAAYAALRMLHAEDLAPMRASLAGFLNAWLGGPRDWFAEHPGVCVMSAHAKMPIDQETADQWIDAMRRAVAEAPINPGLGARMVEALSGMAQAMAGRPASGG
ncbi:group II truncated hemoglobin (plasmid) [Sphingobium naphthae]|uniref:group II truncated hemoglobin n=1 Tax=Sphingobium naphthae TaxID=1886786 RepID=UPI000C959454|nr:globin [Erythrobacter sp.]MEA3390979.1 group II truncated hemoglobin [Pseudomonadota bacterium]|tara:strand:- start:147 stop:560 length:414 start_codon:yes stop_codon:yes gene_type:complete